MLRPTPTARATDGGPPPDGSWRRRRSPATRGVTGAALLAMVLALVVSPDLAEPDPAGAAVPRDACPSEHVPATPFTDTVRSPHRAAIDCLAWWDLTEGRSATSYGGDRHMTRGQMAAMIARLLERTGDAPQAVPSAGFDDTGDSIFADEIDLVAHLGIVRGTSSTTFEPDGATTRAQMATIVAGMLERAYELDLPAGQVPFEDVSAGNVHRDAVGQLVEAGITTGTSATTYHPGRAVDRSQMAAFLTRSTSRLVDEGRADLPTSRPGPDDAYASSVRGTWIHLFDDTLKSEASIREVVDELAEAEVNTIYAQVARRHDAYYASDVLPATLDPGLEDGLDILEELIPRAHAAGIEVEAWFTVAPTWHAAYAELGVDEDTIEELGAEPEWRTETRDGQPSTYLDPGVPEVQDHVAEVVAELAADYDLDGIHLDYVRYESNEHGYHERSLERFQEYRDRTDVPDPTDGQWASWRRSQTRAVFDRARAAIQAADPDVELSAATISWDDGPATPDRDGFRGTRSFRDVLQDWDALARNERIDTILPMNYYREHVPEQAAGFQRWLRYEQALAADTDTAIVPGIGGWLNTPEAALRQAQDAMALTDGVTIYSYQQPTDDGDGGLWDALARSRWGYAPAAP
jgi:uncharacterized lipoprotein YddW (UPF0748 family)